MAIEDENPFFAGVAQPGFDVPRAFRRGVADDFAVRPDERGYGPVYDPSTDISSRNLEAFMAAGGVDPIYVPSWLKASGKDVRGRTPYENIQLMPGTNYRLVDFTGKNDNTVLASGRTPEELFRLQQIVTNQLVPQGGQANWRLEREGEKGWETIGGDLYNKPITGMIADIALPAALAAIPGLGAIGTGLAAAGGSALSSGIQGRSLEDTLLRAAITGGTAGLMAGTGADKAIGNVFSGGGSKLGATAAELAAQKAAAEAAGEMVVTGIRNAFLPGAISGLTSGALSTGISNLAPDTFQQALDQARLDNQFGAAPDPSEIVVSNTATKASTFPRGTLTAPITLPDGTLDFGDVGQEMTPSTRRPDDIRNIFGPLDATGNLPTTEGELLESVGKRYDDASLGDYLSVPVSGTYPIPEGAVDALPDDTIDVTGERNPPPFSAELLGIPAAAAIAAPAVVAGGGAPQGPLGTSTPATPATSGGLLGGLTVGKVLGGLSLLDMLSGALGGKGGNTAAGRAGPLNPVFSAKLPGASAAFSQQSLAPRPGGVSGPAMTDIDWYRYGYNPERSFFNYVPATDAEREAMMVKPPSSLELKARGGALAAKKGGAPAKESFAVKGPGTGRSDEIPALLSDGEYVIDAETVALLGDGSSEAGAKRLDDFRVNIRKHKGRNLARGKFSANAKQPDKYLSGGRV